MWPALTQLLYATPGRDPQRLRELLDRHGGFTVRLRSGLPPVTGISVATQPDRSISFAFGEWSDRLVDEWVMAAASQPMWGPSAIGGWVDPESGTVWLDLVRVVPAGLRPLAKLLGRAKNQHCVFDLGRGQTLLVR